MTGAKNFTGIFQTREENSSFSHEERGILIRGIPREEIIRGKRGIDQSKIRIF